MNYIELYGVKQNNLKNIDVKIPIGKFTAICGPSGSGKSSLAFETLYAEGQRRYIESMSIYVRQFLDKAPKPELSNVENIPPAVAINQINKVKTSRSTVGTVTELLDYLRICFAKVGKSYCPTHNVKIEKKALQDIVKIIFDRLLGKRAYILTSILSDRNHIIKKGTREHLIGYLDQLGYTRAFYKNKIIPLGKSIELKDDEEFELVIDRLILEKKNEPRLLDAISESFRTYSDLNAVKGGVVRILTPDGLELKFSQTPKCYKCGFMMPEVSVQLFNFNNPIGACKHCEGIGQILSIDEAKVIPDKSLSIKEGALRPFSKKKPGQYKKLITFCKKNNIDTDLPWSKLTAVKKKKIFEGDKSFVGIDRYFEELCNWNYPANKYILHHYQGYTTCSYCDGTRLEKEALFVKVGNKNIHEICNLTIEEAYDFFNNLKLSIMDMKIIKEPLAQILSRLKYLIDVGLSYLTLSRTTRTLSGGEYQRIRLASQLGLCLSQTMYVLDEPTIGLHPQDNYKLIGVLKKLKDLGNTLVVVEHDKDVIKNSDYIVEMGLNSGMYGGEVIYSGDTSNFLKNCPTVTSKIITNKIPQKTIKHRTKSKNFISISGCRGHNLKDIAVKIPMNRFVTVTGVSGSGKSSLINHTIYPALSQKLNNQMSCELAYDSLDNFDGLDDVILIDQNVIGKTLRSMPATFVGIYDDIRKQMSNLKFSRNNGYSASHFSINLVGGRCDVCEGTGFEVIDMAFMDDVKIVCENCEGKRFKKGILKARLNGKNICEILDLTVDEAINFFDTSKGIKKALLTLQKVGLGYIKIGQSTQTLSGGESQRLKISKELNRAKAKSTIYFLDEPTTGLHPNEISLLIEIIDDLIESGSGVVMIEHNLDMIAASDYIIELGPGGGKYGGKLIFQGSTQDILKEPKSITAPYLKDHIVV